MPARASYYVVRPGPTTRLPSGMVVQEPGRFVPLIAVDQLPDWLEVVGVPRQLPFAQAADMIAIGAVSRPPDFRIHGTAASCEHGQKLDEAHDDGNGGDVFEVRVLRDGVLNGGRLAQQDPSSGLVSLDRGSDTITPPLAASARWPLVTLSFLQRDEAQTEDATKTPAAKMLTSSPSKAAATSEPGKHTRPSPASDSSGTDNWQIGRNLNARDKVWPRDHSVSSCSRAPKAATAPHASKAQKMPKAPIDLLDRRPCKHWCQTGNCSFKSGCKYRHVMPTTSKGLRDVGLCQLPVWWLDKEKAAAPVS